MPPIDSTFWQTLLSPNAGVLVIKFLLQIYRVSHEIWHLRSNERRITACAGDKNKFQRKSCSRCPDSRRRLSDRKVTTVDINRSSALWHISRFIIKSLTLLFRLTLYVQQGEKKITSLSVRLWKLTLQNSLKKMLTPWLIFTLWVELIFYCNFTVWFFLSFLTLS